MAQLTDLQRQLLREPLDETLLDSFGNGPQRGEKFFPASATIRQLNRIFGHGEWLDRVLASHQLELKETKSSKSTMGFVASYKVEVEVTAGGVARVGWGYCTSIWQPTSGEAIEYAEQGARTMGIKQACYYWGDQFGAGLKGGRDHLGNEYAARMVERFAELPEGGATFPPAASPPPALVQQPAPAPAPAVPPPVAVQPQVGGNPMISRDRVDPAHVAASAAAEAARPTTDEILRDGPPTTVEQLTQLVKQAKATNGGAHHPIAVAAMTGYGDGKVSVTNITALLAHDPGAATALAAQLERVVGA